MGKFLFTMWPANDLGLPSRLVPIARLLADRGHEVEPVYRRSAERVGESMRKYGGAREAADRIEKLAAQRRVHRADVPTS